MLPKSRSITRRLIVAVMLVECVAALVLVTAVTVNERHVQYKIFDTVLRGTSNALFGGVQDADDTEDNVILDLRGVVLPKNAVFLVQDDRGRILGRSGEFSIPSVPSGQFETVSLNGRSYRFYSFSGDRIIDPKENGGVHHRVSILFGLPDGHVWHEVWEAIRFFSIAAFVLLTLTALLLIALIRKLTHPIHQLAEAAEGISVYEWTFTPPEEAREVIELRPLVAALERAMQRLHSSFKQQKRFTSDAAHELKTDLAIVKSSFQLLSMKPRTNEEYRSGVSIGLKDLARLEETVQRMLTLARLEQPIIGEHIACNIAEVLMQAMQQAEPAAEVKGVALEAAVIQPAQVHCDSRDAFLLCSNLLVNAIYYTEEHSTVSIQCDVEESHCVISIRDSGSGVDEAELPFLFEAFYRGDPSRSRKSGGTGLGLSICKAICDRAGGSISIANNAVAGAEVRVELPLVSENDPGFSVD
ncbi:MAG: HAMP domain-containing sensor histidine kinase [Acidobacteriaceae bacterium]|nr:HAMP domain-containing sensor histidine kinase [Acidobacteriaceae bacterium]